MSQNNEANITRVYVSLAATEVVLPQQKHFYISLAATAMSDNKPLVIFLLIYSSFLTAILLAGLAYFIYKRVRSFLVP